MRSQQQDSRLLCLRVAVILLLSTCTCASTVCSVMSTIPVTPLQPLPLPLYSQAEAALPPPFPSNAPMRAYISNMAVVPSARRQGLAKTLCSACGRIAKAWGEPCVLLHVASDNTSAQQLYAGCGFIPVSNSQGISGLIKGPWTQQRMVVDAAALAGRYQRLPGAGNCRSGSSASAAQATSLQPHRADAA